MNYKLILVIIIQLIRLQNSTYLNKTSTFSTQFYKLNSYCPNADYSISYFQSAISNSTYSTTDGISLVSKSGIPAVLASNQMKFFNGSLFTLLGSNSLYAYNDTPNAIITVQYFTFPQAVIDFDFIDGSINGNRSDSLIYLSLYTVSFKSFPLGSSVASSYSFNQNLEFVKCVAKYQQNFCFIGAHNRLIILDINRPSVYNYVDMASNTFITALNVRLNESSYQVYLYLGLNTGIVSEYLFKNGKLTIKRQCTTLAGFSIQSIIPHFLGELIYIFSNQSSFVTIITKNGYLHQSIDYSYMQNFSMNFDIKAKQVSNTSVIVYNSNSNFALFFAQQNFTLTNSLAQPGLQVVCENGYFYNQISMFCQTCAYGCLTCQKYTGTCDSCINSYFLYQGSCKSCVYDNLSVNYASECFSSTKLSLLQASQSITPALVSGVVMTYSFFSGSSLIFVFYRLFNFWSLISLYYFLPMNIPFLLQKLLSKIFDVYYSSIFQLFGIQLNISFNSKQKPTNDKLKSASISTDFIASNLDNLIVFTYSVLLICTIFKGLQILIKNRYGIQIFQKIRLQACLEEFVGLFITFLIPLPFLMKVPYFFSFNDKVNMALQFLVFGFILIFPFLYLAAIQKPQNTRKVRNIKILKNQIQTKGKDKNQKAKQKNQKIKEKDQKAKKENASKNQNMQSSYSHQAKFWNQQQGQNFIYCCISLAAPFFVTIKPIQIFLFGGLVFHYFSVQNSLNAKTWRINLFIHKSTFLLYHTSYVFMYYCQNEQVQFFIAALSFFLIVFGGLHELLTAIAQKVAFILKTCKSLKNNKIKNTHQTGQSTAEVQNCKQTQKQKLNQHKSHCMKANQIKQQQILGNKQKQYVNTQVKKQLNINKNNKKLQNEPLIFKTLKQIKHNEKKPALQLTLIKQSDVQDAQDVQGISYQSQSNQTDEYDHSQSKHIDSNQTYNKNQDQPKGLPKTQKTVKQQSTNKIENETQKHKFKIKPVIITKKYVAEDFSSTKKTIKQKIKLKWSDYIVKTFKDINDDQSQKQNSQIQEISYKNKFKITKKETGRQFEQDDNVIDKIKVRSLNRTAHNL